MDLLSLDLGCTTGWAAWHDGKVTSCGYWVLGPEPGRYADLAEELRFRLPDWAEGPTVAYELVRRHMGTQAAHVYGALRGVVLTVAAERNCPIVPVEVAAVKRAMTGRGRAAKEEMCTAALDYWLHPVTHDVADAIGVGLAALAQTNEEDPHG